MSSKKRGARGSGFSERIAENRKRWARLDGFIAIHYVVPDGEYGDRGEGSLPGWGESHILTIVKRTGGNNEPKMSVDLSELTEKELDAFAWLVNEVIDQARPVVRLRDEKAQEAFDNGDDTFYRLYRAVPDVVDRSGSSGEHGQSDEE